MDIDRAGSLAPGPSFSPDPALLPPRARGYFSRVPTRPLPVLAAILLVAACQSGSKSLDRGLSVASTKPPSSLLRLPAAGGNAELYRPPTLEPWGWQSDAALPVLSRLIGADLSLNLVYVLGEKARDVVALDLLSRRPRPPLIANVRDVTMGPDGTVYTVDDSLRIVEFVRRNPIRFQARLAARPKDLFGARNTSLLALSAGAKGQLALLHPDEETRDTPIPTGDAAATFWGDLVAVAADSVVRLIRPDDPKSQRSIPIEGHARAVLFSPSGHRFYVARRDGGVLVFNRFTFQQVAEVELPGSAGALRSDPFGRWLMVRPPAGDSLWLVDMATNRFLGGIAAEWANDLPTITNQQVLLVKTRGDVVAYDLASEEWPERGRVRGGARDFWVHLAWTPETGTASALAERPAEPTAAAEDSEETEDRPSVYLQVSSSQNRAWADQLARQLEQQGLPASVLERQGGEEGYRVVLGPYPSREAAESTGRRLGRPFFVYQPDR